MPPPNPRGSTLRPISLRFLRTNSTMRSPAVAESAAVEQDRVTAAKVAPGQLLGTREVWPLQRVETLVSEARNQGRQDLVVGESRVRAAHPSQRRAVDGEVHGSAQRDVVTEDRALGC
jgi:hypothetical protein